MLWSVFCDVSWFNIQEQAITEVQRSEEAPLKNNSRIPVRITSRNRMISVNGSVNHTVLSNVKRQSKTYGISSIISANVRSIAKKLDELHQLALYNNVGMICITETWLTSNIPDSSVSIPGFNLFRKDRVATFGGGVCVYLDQRIPCKILHSCDDNHVESLWLSLRPFSLPREITSIILGVIYHSTRNNNAENVILKDHIQGNLDKLLADQPNALVVITGDFNPNVTGLCQKDITHPNNLTQLVSFNTRDANDTAILDWFLTNKPKTFSISRLPKVGSSDHYAILAKPTTSRPKKATINKIKVSLYP